MKNLPKLDEFIAKFHAEKKKNKLDLSSDQDLSIAIMNLIAIEEHLFYSGGKTGEHNYYDLIAEVRTMRKELLLKLIPNYSDGSERWCISKHLLAASMRLMEVGTKQIDLKHKTAAYDFFQKSYDLYTLFWGINFNLIDVPAAKVAIDIKTDKDLDVSQNNKTGLRATWQKLVQKLVNCCLE